MSSPIRMPSPIRVRSLAALVPCGLLVLCCLASLVACKDVERALPGLRGRKIGEGNPFATDAVARAARDLEAKLGAPVRALGLEVSNHHIVFTVQDPKKPENVDAYELQGGELVGPRPVQLMGGGPLDANLFPLAELPLARLPELAKAALAEVELEGGKVSSVTVRRKFSRIPPQMRDPGEKVDIPDGGIAVEIYVDGPRRKAYVLANGDFEIVRTNVY